MCVILEKPKGIVLTAEQIKNAWASNPDGAGLLVSDGHTVTFEKGFMKLTDFEKVVEKTNAKSKDVYSVLHFRISTGGKINEENTHPFCLEDTSMKSYKGREGTRSFLFHNGIFNITPTKVKSDTWILADMLKYVKGNNSKTHVIEPVRNSSRVLLTDGREKALVKLGTWQNNDGINASNLHYTCHNTVSFSGYDAYYKEYEKYVNYGNYGIAKNVSIHSVFNNKIIGQAKKKLLVLDDVKALVENRRPQDFEDMEAIDYALMVAKEHNSVKALYTGLISLNNTVAKKYKRKAMLNRINAEIKSTAFDALSVKEKEISKLKVLKGNLAKEVSSVSYRIWNEFETQLKKYSPFVFFLVKLHRLNRTNSIPLIKDAIDKRIVYLTTNKHEIEKRIHEKDEELLIEGVVAEFQTVTDQEEKAKLMYNAVFCVFDNEKSTKMLNVLFGDDFFEEKCRKIKKYLNDRLEELFLQFSDSTYINESYTKTEIEMVEQLLIELNSILNYEAIFEVIENSTNWISSDDTIADLFDTMDTSGDEEAKIQAFQSILQLHLQSLKNQEKRADMEMKKGVEVYEKS